MQQLLWHQQRNQGEKETIVSKHEKKKGASERRVAQERSGREDGKTPGERDEVTEFELKGKKATSEKKKKQKQRTEQQQQERNRETPAGKKG